MRSVIAASDSFKGTFTSLDIAQQIRDALPEDAWDVIPLAISDGGEGFCHALTYALGGEYVSLTVHDPLKRLIKAEYGILPDNTAVIELAAASGLMLLKPNEYDPWNATTIGTGEFIADAIRRDCRKLIIGLGGSATSDCGTGILQAIEEDEEVVNALNDCHFIIATDVQSPLCGPNGAARMFAPQKGADAALVKRLEERSQTIGSTLEKRAGHPIMDVPGAGAAGGAAAALLTMPHAELRSGIELMLDLQHFNELLTQADAVITGEGCIDNQTLHGKAPYGIAQRCHQSATHPAVPCVALYGRLALSPEQQAQSPWDVLLPISNLSSLFSVLQDIIQAPQKGKRQIKG